MKQKLTLMKCVALALLTILLALPQTAWGDETYTSTFKTGSQGTGNECQAQETTGSNLQRNWEANTAIAQENFLTIPKNASYTFSSRYSIWGVISKIEIKGKNLINEAGGGVFTLKASLPATPNDFTTNPQNIDVSTVPTTTDDITTYTLTPSDAFAATIVNGKLQLGFTTQEASQDGEIHSISVTFTPCLKVGDVAVDIDHKDNFLNGVSFTQDTYNETTSNILTISGDISEQIVVNNIHLTLGINGHHRIVKEWESASSLEPVIKGEANCSLTIKKMTDAASLVLASYKEQDGEIGNEANVISGFTVLTVEDFEQTHLTPLDNNGIKYTAYYLNGYVYDMAVNGYTIHKIPNLPGNKDNILSEDTPTVTYDDSSNKLTLDGANLTNGIETGMDLTIDLKGNNSITTSTGWPISRLGETGSPTITFTSSSSPVGILTLKSNNTEVKVLEENVNILYDTSIGMTSTIIAPTNTNELTEASEAIITKGSALGLYVGGVLVTTDNLAEITGDNITGTVSFNSNSNTLTLNEATITGNIQSSINNLKVQLIGASTITPGEYAPFQYTGDAGTTAATLTFESTEAEAGDLTMGGTVTKNGSGTNVSLTIGGYSISNTFDDGSGTGNSGEWQINYPDNTYHIYRNIIYKLWVGSYQVTKANKTSISSGYPTFDDERTSLILSGAYPGLIVRSALPTLNILVKGNCSLQNIIFDSEQSASGGTLSIQKDPDSTDEEITLTLGETGDNSPAISGFTSVTYDDFIILEDGASYSDGKLVNANNEVLTGAEFATSVTLSKPDISCEESDGLCTLYLSNNNDYGTLKYSIVYADGSDGVTDATYNDDNAPTLSKPATVTAYVSLNGVTSDDAVGKYFGMEKEAYSVAVDGTLTPTLIPDLETTDDITCTYSTTSNVISIADGVITGVSAGSATVTATLSQSNSAAVPDVKLLNAESLTFTVNVGAKLSDLFVGDNDYGTYYNADATTYAVPEGMKAYVITGVSSEEVILEETTVLPANTAVLLERGTATAFTKIEATGAAPGGNKLMYASTDVTAGTGSSLYVLYNDVFVKVTAGTKISGRSYLDLSSISAAGTRGFYNINGDDGTTGIDEVRSEGVNSEKWADDDKWFDLQGRRIQKPTKTGLYIVNGKKMVVNNK